MLTVDDIKKLTEVFATKHDLKEFATKHELQELTNQVLDRLDSVFGEVKIMRQEQAAHSQVHEDIQERLTTIEAVPVITH